MLLSILTYYRKVLRYVMSVVNHDIDNLVMKLICCSYAFFFPMSKSSYNHLVSQSFRISRWGLWILIGLYLVKLTKSLFWFFFRWDDSIFFIGRGVSVTQKRSSSPPILQGFLSPNWQGRGLGKHLHLTGNDIYSFMNRWTQDSLLNNSQLERVGSPACVVWLETNACLQEENKYIFAKGKGQGELRSHVWGGAWMWE